MITVHAVEIRDRDTGAVLQYEEWPTVADAWNRMVDIWEMLSVSQRKSRRVVITDYAMDEDGELRGEKTIDCREMPRSSEETATLTITRQGHSLALNVTSLARSMGLKHGDTVQVTIRRLEE